MSYPINYPTPQSCNVQIFYGRNKGTTANAPIQAFDWVKPKGVSFVWFTLIGGGGGGQDSVGGNGGGGGGSGAVTNCLMPAFLVPDQLRVATTAASNISILYQGQNLAAGYTLLTANGGSSGGVLSGGAGGTASAKTPFAVAGLYQSIAGQSSTFGSNTTASATTFLSAGSNAGFTVQPNYGYPTAASNSDGTGFFQMSPIIVGRGGAVLADGDGIQGGIGCGGGGTSTGAGDLGGRGGQSMAVIISW